MEVAQSNPESQQLFNGAITQRSPSQKSPVKPRKKSPQVKNQAANPCSLGFQADEKDEDHHKKKLLKKIKNKRAKLKVKKDLAISRPHDERDASAAESNQGGEHAYPGNTSFQQSDEEEGEEEQLDQDSQLDNKARNNPAASENNGQGPASYEDALKNESEKLSKERSNQLGYQQMSNGSKKKKLFASVLVHNNVNQDEQGPTNDNEGNQEARNDVQMGQNGQVKSPLRRAENESLKCSESMKQGNNAALGENGKDQIEADAP